MSLQLSVAELPLEKLPVEVVVVGCVEDERPLRGAAARADWRLCGAISDLLARGELHGRAGEAALLPCVGGLRAERVLALGLGPRSRPAAERLRGFAGDALARLLGLRAGHSALALLPGDYGGVRDQLEQLVTGLAETLPASESAPALGLQLVPSPHAVALAREELARLSTQPWSRGLAFGQ